jgi:hypothetical protein
METSVTTAPPIETSAPTISVFQRAALIFLRPAGAWDGLETRAQWWFPLLVMMIVSAVSGTVLQQRAILPMMTETWDNAVQDGKMTAAQEQKMEDFMSSPGGTAFTVAWQVVVVPLVTLLAALFIWFGCGFVLGTRFRYRLALEVAAWASLINLPGFVLTTVLGSIKHTMKGIHTGFGILLPESDTPSKLLVGAGAFLDGIGPLAIWYLAVVILGAAALSGAKTKSVAWVLGGLYLAVLVFLSAMGAMFAPSAR